MEDEKTEVPDMLSVCSAFPDEFILLNPFTHTSQVTDTHFGMPLCWPAQTETVATATEATSFSQEKNNVYCPGLLIPISYTPSLHLELLTWTWKIL